MKYFPFLIFLLISGILTAATPPEDPQPNNKHIKYIYGSLDRDIEHIRHILDPKGENKIDPFSNQPAKKNLAGNNQTKPLTQHEIPLCLPPYSDFKNVTEVFRIGGVKAQDGAWILFSEEASQLYFCLTYSDADILEQIVAGLVGNGPRSINQVATVVSIENQGISTPQAWTIEALKQASPKIHARYGVSSRSGEKSDHVIRENNQHIQGIHELEPTIGESRSIFEARHYFQCSLTENPAINLSHQTAFTANIGHPFILDCGIHGKDKRNYLLVMDSHMPPAPQSGWAIKVHAELEKIDGIYALRKKQAHKPIPAPQGETKTLIYQSPPDFLRRLRSHVENAQYAEAGESADPFCTTPMQFSPPPIRVTQVKKPKLYHSSDRVFNVTPQLHTLGLNPFQNEWIYYNATRKKIIVHGCDLSHQNSITLIERICPAKKAIQILAHVVSVKSQTLSSPEWSMKKVQQSSMKTLATYASICRNGEKSTSGDPTLLADENATSDFEIEATIGLSGEYIDLRYYLKTDALSEDKISHQLTSAITLKEGTPTIIELGHPSSGTHTHLLILHTSSITQQQ